MTAVAAVWTGSAQDKSGESPILLFSDTKDGQLAVSSHKSTSANHNENFLFPDEKNHQAIIEGSQIASGTLGGIHLVAAATKPNNNESEEVQQHKISIVSPSHMRLGHISKKYKKVAMSVSNSVEKAWVYSVNEEDEKVCLMEYIYPDRSSLKYLEGFEFAPDTSLAAYCFEEGKKRFVIFQNKDQKLIEFNINSNTSAPLDLGNITPKQNTSTMAVTVYNGLVYLYFVDTNDQLHRVINRSGVWEKDTCKPVGDIKIKSGQITVMTAGGYNHIFYMPSGSANVAGVGAQHKLDSLQVEF